MGAPKGPVRPMTDRIKEIYAPPANVSIAQGPEGAAKPSVVLVSANQERVDALRGEADALRIWGTDLRRAELAGDWAKVAAVREDIAAAALGLDELAYKHERGKR
jgi:hypothetical protein